MKQYLDLLRHVLDRNPALRLDEATRAFLDGARPARFETMGEFAAHDARYR